MISPHHAAKVWTLDEYIYAELPGQGIKSHTIRFPNTTEGLSQLLSTLNARTNESRLGEKGDPTQHHVEKMQALAKDYAGPIKRKPKLEVPTALRAKCRDVLRELGII